MRPNGETGQRVELGMGQGQTQLLEKGTETFTGTGIERPKETVTGTETNYGLDTGQTWGGETQN